MCVCVRLTHTHVHTQKQLMDAAVFQTTRTPCDKYAQHGSFAVARSVVITITTTTNRTGGSLYRMSYRVYIICVCVCVCMYTLLLLPKIQERIKMCATR